MKPNPGSMSTFCIIYIFYFKNVFTLNTIIAQYRKLKKTEDIHASNDLY